MMARIAFLLLAVAGCARPAAVPDSPALRALRTIRFLPECGAAWMVSDRLLVTNRHVAICMSGRPDVYAKRRWVTVHRLATRRFVDLALLRLEEPDSHAVVPPRGQRRVEVGDVLYTLGPTNAMWSFDYAQTSRRGWVLRAYRVIAHPEHVPDGLDGVIVLEGAAYRGQSGAPVVTEAGEVVGTLYAATKTHAFVIPVEPYLQELLAP